MIAYYFVLLVYPFALLVASVLRASIVSYAYFLTFLLSVLLLPHKQFNLQNVVSSVLPLFTTIVSVASVALILVVNLVAKFNYNYTLQQLGFFKYTTVVEGLLNVLPDIIAIIVSSIAASLWHRKRIEREFEEDGRVTPATTSSISIGDELPKKTMNAPLLPQQPQQIQLPRKRRERDPVYYNPPPSKGLSFVAFLMLCLSAVSFPSVINAFYFIFAIGFILCLSARISVHRIMTRIYPFFLALSFLQLLFIYLVQIPIINENYQQDIDDWYGVRNYGSWDISIWPLVTGYVTILFLYVLSCIILRQKLLYTMTKKHYKLMLQKEKRLSKVEREQELANRFTKIAVLFASHGWTICCVEINIVCLFLNSSIYTSILLVTGSIASLVPTRAFKWFSKLVLCYILVFITLQYCFNIPLNAWSETPTTRLIGFFIWSTSSIWLYIGVQLIIAITFGLYCFYSYMDMSLHHKSPALKLKTDDHPTTQSNPNISTTFSTSISSTQQQKKDLLVMIDDTQSDAVGGGAQTTTLKQRPVLKRGPQSPPPLRSHLKKGVSFQIPSNARPLSPSASSVDFSRSSYEARIRPYASMISDSWKNFWAQFTEHYGDSLAKAQDIAKSIFVGFFLTIFSQSYRLALAGLFVCGLTQISLLNAGYMVFFIIFIISERLATRFWILLVIYAQVVYMLLYTWQIGATTSLEGETTDLIGLVHYRVVWFGLLWKWIIVIFTLTQWNLNKMLRDTKLPSFVQTIGDLIYNISQHYCLPICYLVIVLVAVFSKVSIISILYMATVFLCLAIHHISANGSVHIRRFWVLIVMSQAAVLVARYVYQFPQVNQWLMSIFPTNRYITLDDIGLTVYQSEYFIELLGNVAILIVCVFQLGCFFTKSDANTKEAIELQLQRHPRLLSTVYWVNRFAYLHGSKLVLWAVFLIALSPPSFFNAIYMVMVLISMVFRKGTYRVGFYILIYSQLLVLFQMAFLFPEAEGVIGHDDLIRWLGMPLSSSSTTWGVVKLNLTIILLVSLQQWAYWWNKAYQHLKKQTYEKKELDPYHCTVSQRIFWYMSHFYELYGVEIVFITLSISLCWRVNVLGIIYLCVIGIGLHLSTQKIRRLFYLSVFMVPIIMAQYIFLLGLPSKSSPPWALSNPLLSNLLLLESPSTYIVSVDFAVLFFSMLLFKIPKRQVPLQFPKNFLKFDDKNFTHEPRPWYSEIRYIIVRFSSQVTLITIFIAGTAECDLISIGYVLFSVYVLFTGQDRSWSRLWKAMAFYNWFVLLSQILFQFVFVAYGDDNNAADRVADILGFTIAAKSSSVSETVSDVIVMVLMAYQKNIYESKDFITLEAHIKSNRDCAFEVARQFYKNRRETRIQQLDSVQTIIQQRRERLQTLKEHRRKRHRHSIYVESFNSRPTGQLTSPGSFTPGSDNNVDNNNEKKDMQLDPITINSPPIEHQPPNLHGEEEVEEDEPSIPVKERIKGWLKSFINWLDPVEEQEVGVNNALPATVHSPTQALPPSLTGASHRNSTFISAEQLKLSFQYYKLYQQQFGEDEQSSSSVPPPQPPYKDDYFKRIVRGVSRIARDESKWIAFMCCICNAIFYANIISLAYAFAVFLFGRLYESPRPSKPFWKFLIGYSSVVICLKYIFQIGVFCVISGVDGYYYASFETCWNTKQYTDDLTKRYLSVPYLIGINDIQGPFLAGSWWDLAVFLACLWHRHVYQSKGLWSFDEASVQEAEPVQPVVGVEDDMTTNYESEKGSGDEEEEEEEEEEQIIVITRRTKKGKKLRSSTSSTTTTTTSSESSLPQQSAILTTTPLAASDSIPLGDSSETHVQYTADGGVETTTTTTTKTSRTGTSRIIKRQDSIDNNNNNNNSNSNNNNNNNNNINQIEMDVHDITPYDDVIEDRSTQEEEWIVSAEEMHHQSINLTVQKQIPPPLPVQWFNSYFTNIFDTSEKTGRDYYIPIFFTDFICLLFLVLFPQNFTAIPSSDITQFLEQNVIPRQYIGILLSQFGIIVLDRIIYLYRSVKAKFAFQVILTVLYHMCLFFYFPDLIQKPFDIRYTWTLVIFYVLKCIYLYYSALQICYGYPILAESRFLMDGYSDFHNIGFAVYRAIPFVFEMRTLLDWIATDTTLLFYDWLKFEDLYATIFSVHCRQEWIKRQGRKKGQKQPIFEKFTIGVAFFVVIVVILWFPLIILSSGLPGSNIEPVTSVNVQVSVMGLNPFVSISQDLSVANLNGIPNWKDTFVNNTYFSKLRSAESFITTDDQAGTQLISINTFSEVNWNLSPPARAQLMQYLTDNELSIRVDYTLSRSGNININIDGDNVVFLNRTQQSDFASIINGTSATNTFTTTGLLYKFIRLPGVSGNLLYPTNPGSSPTMIDVLFTLVTVNNTYPPQEYWMMSQTDGTPLNFITISSRLPNGLASTLVSAGIIGLYVGVVLSVGRFLRMYVTGMALRITLENIQVCDEVEKMLEDVLIARQYGDLILEEELYNELIQVFRNPNLLYEMTKKQS